MNVLASECHCKEDKQDTIMLRAKVVNIVLTKYPKNKKKDLMKDKNKSSYKKIRVMDHKKIDL